MRVSSSNAFIRCDKKAKNPLEAGKKLFLPEFLVEELLLQSFNEVKNIFLKLKFLGSETTEFGTFPQSISIVRFSGLTPHFTGAAGMLTSPVWGYPQASSEMGPSPKMFGIQSHGKKKERPRLTQAQRRAAHKNTQKRKRRLCQNNAFKELRQILPTFPYEENISNLDTLRLSSSTSHS